MLRELAVRDLALIDKLRVAFEPGLTVITGETGAGKSLLIDALGLVMGARSDSGLVRHGAAGARVEALFDVDASESLTERQKQRVRSKAGAVVRAVAQDERSQARNRELAVERLLAKLRDALRVERRRVATRPTNASVERRLEAKRRRSAIKRRRAAPPED